MARCSKTKLLTYFAAGVATLLSACSGSPQAGAPLLPTSGSNEMPAQAQVAGSPASRSATSGQHVAVSATTPPSYTSAVLSANPLAYYPLDDGSTTLTDAAAHHINGVYGSLDSASGPGLRLNATASESLPGGSKYGYDRSKFDQVPQNAQLEPASTLSVEAWLRVGGANTSGTNVSVVAYGGPNSGGEPYLLALTPSNQVQWSILGAGATAGTVAGKTALSPNVPHHVVATYDGATLQIYVDGNLDGSGAARGPITYGRQRLHPGLSIGGALNSRTATLAGDLSDVAIYGSTLPASTILTHYQLGTTAGTPQPTPSPTPQSTLPPGVTLTSETPKTAFAFSDSFGANSVFGDYQAYGSQFSTLGPMLDSGSIRHLRDGNAAVLPGIYYLPMFQNLCQNGIRHSVAFPIKTTTASGIIAAINQYSPQCIDFVEPQNEMDALAGYGKKDSNWPKEIVAEQTLLYNTMKSVPAFANITVLGPALSNPANYSLLGNLDAISDAGNSHSAMCDANPGSTFYGTLGHRVSVVKASWPTKPVWVTETDYNDNSSNGGHCAVPDDVMAKYVARTQTERFNLGEPRIYWFSLKDRPQVIAGDEGLLRSNNSPKPAYIEMTNLMQVVGDATSSTPQPINWALVGSATIHHTLLQKSDGTYELLLWNEVPSWDTRRHVEMPVSSQSATVYLQQTIGTATYYTFNASNQMVPMSVNQRGGGFTIPVSDNISVLDFK